MHAAIRWNRWSLSALIVVYITLSSQWLFIQGISLLKASANYKYRRPRPLHSFSSNRNLYPILRMRGGAIDSSSLRGKRRNENDDLDETAIVARRGMSAALAATYFSVMATKCALPAVLAQLTSPKTGLRFPSDWSASNQALMARLLSLSTLAIASGKLLLGPIIDYFGGVLSLKAALSALAVLMGIISVSNSFLVFAYCWVFVDFIFSSCWAGCINAIHQSFPEKVWANKIGMLAAAARTGNACAFAFFAILLDASKGMAQPWRAVFATSAMIQVVPIALLTYCSRDTTPKEDLSNKKKSGKKESPIQQIRSKASMKGSLATLRREATKPEFWLHLTSRSVLMVYASFLLFVPTLLTKVYGASPSFAAQVGSIYALGCLLAVTFGSNVYASLRRNQKVASILTFLGMSTISSVAQYGHMKGLWQLSQGVSAAFLFLWGFSFAIPFYIPPSLYALARGGTKSSATIADGKFLFARVSI